MRLAIIVGFALLGILHLSIADDPVVLVVAGMYFGGAANFAIEAFIRGGARR